MVYKQIRFDLVDRLISLLPYIRTDHLFCFDHMYQIPIFFYYFEVRRCTTIGCTQGESYLVKNTFEH